MAVSNTAMTLTERLGVTFISSPALYSSFAGLTPRILLRPAGDGRVKHGHDAAVCKLLQGAPTCLAPINRA
jgi:hypothetical protein